MSDEFDDLLDDDNSIGFDDEEDGKHKKNKDRDDNKEDKENDGPPLTFGMSKSDEDEDGENKKSEKEETAQDSEEESSNQPEEQEKEDEEEEDESDESDSVEEDEEEKGEPENSKDAASAKDDVSEETAEEEDDDDDDSGDEEEFNDNSDEKDEEEDNGDDDDDRSDKDENEDEGDGEEENEDTDRDSESSAAEDEHDDGNENNDESDTDEENDDKLEPESESSETEPEPEPVNEPEPEPVNEPEEETVSEEEEETEESESSETEETESGTELTAEDFSAPETAAEISTGSKKGASKKAEKAAETAKSAADGGDVNDGIILKSISKVMHESMIPYSEFVIMDRALPRVEDGLKPVQRRILYAMHEMGLEPDKPFRKSAGIVGECLGKYHPHGDTSVYDAMVRLAQPFNMNMPLVIGQGNFGSEDGDPPAAMRYTEAKLGWLALELLRDIDKETVPFSLTFDDRNTEPDILPGRYPNLLVNGATGIAVGLATNIAPHNLAEVIDAHVAYIDNPKITLHQVMKIIRGPDFPTGGFVMCGDDLHTAYKTGKGRVVMRAKIHIEVEGNDRRNIVITELPYQVNKVLLQRNIADLRESKKGALSGISEIRDESDRKGMRIVIKVKRESDPKAICDMLFKYTNLQCNYNINMVAIASGKPKLMGLMEMIHYYVDYQRDVIYKRCVFDLENAKERAHILEGLLIAIRNIDEVVRIIKTSKHTTEARQRLRDTFNLSERQAQAILDLRLARLTSLEVFKLEEELAMLKKLIAELEKIIASKQLQLNVVKQEMLEIKKKHKIERRSRIISSLEDAVITADDDEKPVEDIVITLTAEGTVKRMSAKHFSMSKTEALSGLGLFDVNTVVVNTQTDKMLYIFTNYGNCYKMDAGDVPECKLRDKGSVFKTIFSTAAEGELPIAVYVLPAEYLPSAQTDNIPNDGNAVKLSHELVWLTRLGMIKRSSWTESCGVIKSIFQCYKSSRGEDTVLRVDEFKPGCTLMLLTSTGCVLHAQTGDVPLQGRIAGGVKGISMADDEYVVCNVVAKRNGYVVAVTNKGNVKRTEVKNIDKMVRYRKGLMFGNLDKDERLVFACVVKGDEDLVAQLENGTVVFTPIEKIPVSDRTGKYKAFPGSKGRIKAAWVHRRKRNN